MKVYYDMFINTSLSLKNIQKLTFLLNGILAEIIFEREFYKRNIEIKDFTINTLQKEYKNYLFASRTILYAKVIKDIRESSVKEAEQFLYTCDLIKEFLIKHDSEATTIDDTSLTKKISTNKKKNTKNDVIDGWRKIINPK